MRARAWSVALAAAIACAVPGVAQATFPYPTQDQPDDYAGYRLPAGPGKTPGDLNGKLTWMYASTPDADATPFTLADERELHGERGAHLADPSGAAQGWQTTTGRPDVTISILDSGIEWDNRDAMRDLRKKIRLSRGEVPVPATDRTASTEPGTSCAGFTGTGLGGYDRNADGVFNVLDYACDSRVDPDPPKGVGPRFAAADGADADGKPMLDPQDVLIAFSDGTDGDGNGYVDDIAGWDFLDDDNDAYDDVQYGHGTGEARDSGGEADNGGALGTCPNCMQIPLRVGTSFVADVNRFGLAVTYAVDNGVDVVQEALGALNKSALAGHAVDYAWNHGVTVIASAADEAAQHNNWPSSYPRVILVNSVTHTDETDATPATRMSYLQFNGCTNFNSKVDLAIPSVSCSSDATGRAAGMAGLVYSAARNAHAANALTAHPSCKREDGSACLLSAAEVKQLLASGSVGGEPQADDVNFSQTPSGQSTELPCPAPGCTDPFLGAPTTRGDSTPTIPRSYPARKGHDQFYGYGRVNMVRALTATAAGDDRLPPEAEITSPDWYSLVDPTKATATVEGAVWARGQQYTCRVLVAPGAYPGEADFEPVASDACDGEPRSMPVSGKLADLSIADLKARFPAGSVDADFRGREHGTAPEQPYGGRPNSAPYGFVVKVVAERTAAGKVLRGEDRRQLHLHRDTDMLDGFPKRLAGDSEASPLFADLDGDNRNELVIANSDGLVHALRRDGTDLPGFPVRGDRLPLHPKAPAFASGAVPEGAGAILATPAAGDLDHDGTVELVAAGLEGRIYVWNGKGERVRTLESDRAYAGIPVTPFANTRKGHLNRTQLGFLGSPVLADLDRNDGGRLEIVAASMDRHVYAFEDDGTPVPGYPVLVADRSKLAAIDPVTHALTFKPDAAADFDQGALVDTPAVGNLTGDARPEIVVGSNESYKEDLNAGGLDQALYSPLGAALSPANGRVFALKPEGEAGAPTPASSPWVAGWPFKVGILQAGVLPLVGEGVTGNPVIGVSPCRDDAAETVRVGVVPAAGVPYLLNPDGKSCLGQTGGKDEGLPTTGAPKEDQEFFAAFGHPAFGAFEDGPGLLVPAAGVVRAADVVLPEYQGGQDYLAAYSGRTGRLEPGWPRPVNDLQFLTGPSVADIDGQPGEEIVGGTASYDLQAFTPAGADVAGWPKLTGDWTVANPLIGSFGTLDTDPAARRVVVGSTRSGQVQAYGTDAPACAAASWPRFHHDNANSGDGRRDAVSPGRPGDATVAGGVLAFDAPGDDLLCGKVASFEVVTADAPIGPEDFGRATAVPGDFPGVAPGSRAALQLPAGGLKRYVAVRGVDEQGNVGRPSQADRGAGAGDGSGGGGGQQGSGNGGQTPGSGSGGVLGGSGGGGGATSCLPARARVTRKGLAGPGLGAFRLGARESAVLRAAGRPSRRLAGGARRWCVRGGGAVAILVRRHRIRVVATTARGHRAGPLRRGARRSSLRGIRRVRRGVFRRGSVIFGLRAGRVRYLAVASSSLRRHPRALRAALVRLRL